MKKNKLFLITLITILCSFALHAQDTVKIYDVSADGTKQVDEAILKATANGKHILLQIGGNWCGWCKLFHKFVEEDVELKKFIEDNYEVLMINFSPENKNTPLLTRLGNPGRFGYPVFVVLDSQGNKLHIQDSGLLEEGRGYNRNKVMGFFRNWTPKAVDIKNMLK